MEVEEIMGKSQRDKGGRAEREVVDFYRARGHSAARTMASGGSHQKGDVVGVEACHIEVKHQESLSIWKALEQCEGEAPALTIPALHFRRNRTGWYVAIPLDDFADLLEEARR